MNGISVLTLVRNREAHLQQLVEGLRRSRCRPDELIIVDMSDVPIRTIDADFPVIIDRLGTDRLELAAARNLAAARARHEHLIFLDVDCIAMADCIGRLSALLATVDGLLCADILYLEPDDARDGWTEASLRAHGTRHPVRSFPAEGYRVETNPGLFWSLAFAVRRTRYAALGGFDAGFVGYGGEDTDFGYRAAAEGVPLIFAGGAIACHQHHEAHDPPVQHVSDIVRNAARFHARWGCWPMEGWLAAFRDMGLIAWTEHDLRLIRPATAGELMTTLTHWPAPAPAPAPAQLAAAARG